MVPQGLPWQQAAKAAEPGHGDTFDSVLSQSVAVVSERVSKTRLQATCASQNAYDTMHSGGVDILDWEPSLQPTEGNPSPSRAFSMRRGGFSRSSTRNAVLAAMAICTPRSATASPRSRTMMSDNGTGTSFLQRQRSTGALAASGVAPPPSGQGKGAAAGASPARASGTRIAAAAGRC